MEISLNFNYGILVDQRDIGIPQKSLIFNLIIRHFKKAVGAVLVFDLTKPLTFENINKWIKDVCDQASP